MTCFLEEIGELLYDVLQYKKAGEDLRDLCFVSSNAKMPYFGVAAPGPHMINPSTRLFPIFFGFLIRIHLAKLYQVAYICHTQ